MLYTALEETGAPPAAGDGAAPAFTDVSGHWAEEPIQSADELGLGPAPAGPVSTRTGPSPAGDDGPHDRCTDLPDENGLGFDDDEIAFWALEAAARTAAAGLFRGTGA